MSKLLEIFFEKWNRVLPTAGALDFAFFMIAVVSGVILVFPYDVAHPKDSLQVMMLTSGGGIFFRSLHYWSAHIFLVMAAFHVIEYLVKSGEKKVSQGLWVRLALAIPVIFYVMLSGFILKGDAEALLARQIFGGLLESIPLLGEYLSFAFLGREDDFQIIYIHHVATATLFIWIVTVEHIKRFWPDLAGYLYALGVSLILAVAIPAGLHDAADPVVKGPWYFIGFQELLHWMSHPAVSVYLLLFFLVIFIFLPRMPKVYRGRVKIGLSLLFIIYLLLTLVGWVFRGIGWQFRIPW